VTVSSLRLISSHHLISRKFACCFNKISSQLGLHGSLRDITIFVLDPIVIFDQNAMTVLMPCLTQIPGHLHDDITAPRRIAPQTVRTIAGQQVGRVPANLCGALRELLRRGLIYQITWYV
jgi:hypothetical protein